MNSKAALRNLACLAWALIVIGVVMILMALLLNRMPVPYADTPQETVDAMQGAVSRPYIYGGGMLSLILGVTSLVFYTLGTLLADAIRGPGRERISKDQAEGDL